MSRRKKPQYGVLEPDIVPGTSIRIVCTGNGAHPEVPFGKSALTSDGEVWTEVVESRATVRERRELDPGLASSVVRSRSLNRSLKTLRFECPRCPLDYQRHGEDWGEIVRFYRASNRKVLDLSKLPV